MFHYTHTVGDGGLVNGLRLRLLIRFVQIIVIIGFFIAGSGSVLTVVAIEDFNVPDGLLPGDIICCEIRGILKVFGAHDVLTGLDHVALYLGKDRGMHWVIEAGYYPFLPNGRRVLVMPLWYLQLYSDVSFLRVDGVNESIRSSVLAFGRSQLNSPYQHLFLIPETDPFRWHANFDPNDVIDPYARWYYCAEFVWSCYYNAGINLDPVFPEPRENNYVEGYGYLRFVSPQNIFDSVNTSVVK